MNKFEEELKNGPVMIDKDSVTGTPIYDEVTLISYFKDRISPEDHQAEIGKIELQNLKYREEIARMQKALRKKNKAIKELNGAVKKNKARLKECEHLRIEANNQAAMEYSLRCKVVEERAGFQKQIAELKSQLKKQQPEIPEFVTELIKYAKENGKTIRWCLYGNCKELYPQAAKWIGADDDIEFTEKTREQQEIFVHAWLNGYTVAKEKRFYLKNKLTGLYLYKNDIEFSECEEGSISWALFKTEFTQQEIDSMAADSYEKIEVQE